MRVVRVRSVHWLALLFATLACSGTARTHATSCVPVLPAAMFDYSDAASPIPRHFLTSTEGGIAFTDNTPPDNQITNAGATLGRVLFYDTRLSASNSVSCASCHQQAFGFGDTARFSRGIGTQHPARRTMALANARFYARGRFFWDERAPSLEAQILQPIHDSLEMGMAVDSLVPRLSATAYYPGFFTAAFGSPSITSERIAAALAQFVRSLVSSGSRFDAMFATGGAPNASLLTASELKGSQIFRKAGCVNCHRTIAQIPDQANNTGLDVTPADTGAGNGRFKPASLRNVAIRPPYMHDGRFATLRDVVDFYSDSVHDTPHLDPRLRNPDGTPRRLYLDSAARESLVAFLRSLTDTIFLHAAKFSNPFRCA